MKKNRYFVVTILILVFTGLVTVNAGHTCYTCGSTNTNVISVVPVGGSAVGYSPLYHCYCSLCNKCYNVVWTDESHNDDGIDPAVTPTCTEVGWSEGKKCTVCDRPLNRAYLEPLGHTEVIDIASATCTERGLTEGRHCSVCEAVIVAQQSIPALGHTEVIDLAVAPTCTQTGLTEGSHCSVCNASLLAQQVIPATGHSYILVETVSQTCEREGYSLMRCEGCGLEIRTDIQDRLPHWYGPWMPNEDGTHTAECIRGCGYTRCTACEPILISMSRLPLSVCPVCGALSGEDLQSDEPKTVGMECVGAQIIPIDKLPDRGEMNVRFWNYPLGKDNSVLRLYTAAVEHAGHTVETGLVTVSLPLGEIMPAFRLVYVSGPDAGMEIPFEVKDETLVFTTSLPGVFALLGE